MIEIDNIHRCYSIPSYEVFIIVALKMDAS